MAFLWAQFHINAQDISPWHDFENHLFMIIATSPRVHNNGFNFNWVDFGIEADFKGLNCPSQNACIYDINSLLPRQHHMVTYISMILTHCCLGIDIIWWHRSGSRFVQQLVQTNNKNTKALHNWPFVRGLPSHLFNSVMCLTQAEETFSKLSKSFFPKGCAYTKFEGDL